MSWKVGNSKSASAPRKKVDVSKVARYFGGGGHVRAAGLTFRGTVYDAVNNLMNQISLQLEDGA